MISDARKSRDEYCAIIREWKLIMHETDRGRGTTLFKVAGTSNTNYTMGVLAICLLLHLTQTRYFCRQILVI